MNKENFVLEINDDYELDRVIDAKDKKIIIKMNLWSLLIFAVGFGIGLLCYIMKERHIDIEIDLKVYLIFLLLYFGVFAIYMVLHEITHGIAYKIFTKQKLTFGFTGFVAFCGVPNIYTSKKVALISTLAPFVVFNFVFLIPIFFLPDIFALLFVLYFATHVSGCVGDLWVSYLLIFKYRNKIVMMNDTGPKQSFYVKK